MSDDIIQRLLDAIPHQSKDNGLPRILRQAKVMREAATEIEKQRAEIERFREALTDIANQETTGPYKWQLVVARLCEIAREALEGRP